MLQRKSQRRQTSHTFPPSTDADRTAVDSHDGHCCTSGPGCRSGIVIVHLRHEHARTRALESVRASGAQPAKKRSLYLSPVPPTRGNRRSTDVPPGNPQPIEARRSRRRALPTTAASILHHGSSDARGWMPPHPRGRVVYLRSRERSGSHPGMSIVTGLCSASVRPVGVRAARAALRSRHSAGTGDGG